MKSNLQWTSSRAPSILGLGKWNKGQIKAQRAVLFQSPL